MTVLVLRGDHVSWNVSPNTISDSTVGVVVTLLRRVPEIASVEQRQLDDLAREIAAEVIEREGLRDEGDDW